MLHVCCTERWPDGAQTTLRIHLLASRQRASLTDVLTHGKTGRLSALRPELTNDSLHLNGAGYGVWTDLLRPYIERVYPKK